MKNLSHYVRVYDDVFPEDMCKDMVECFESEKAANSPLLRSSAHTWERDYRRFDEIDITKSEAFQPFIQQYYDRVKQVYTHYKSAVNEDFFPSRYAFEDARLKKYNNNDYDQFGWHVDVGDKHSAERFLVMFTYLNTVDEGGLTRFKSDFDFVVKPVVGRMVVFPPMWMYPHIGEKPVSNSKYILSTYVHYV